MQGIENFNYNICYNICFDFGLSYMGYNLTPFLPDGISRFSPIIIGLIGGALINIDWK